MTRNLPTPTHPHSIRPILHRHHTLQHHPTTIRQTQPNPQISKKLGLPHRTIHHTLQTQPLRTTIKHTVLQRQTHPILDNRRRPNSTVPHSHLIHHQILKSTQHHRTTRRPTNKRQILQRYVPHHRVRHKILIVHRYQG